MWPYPGTHSDERGSPKVCELYDPDRYCRNQTIPLGCALRHGLPEDPEGIGDGEAHLVPDRALGLDVVASA